MRVRNAKRTITILLSILLTLFFAISLTVIIKTHVDIEAADLSNPEMDQLEGGGSGNSTETSSNIMEGGGTLSNPYKISTIQELQNFIASIIDTNNPNNYTGKYIKLTADINCYNTTITPIGKYVHTIDRNTITQETKKEYPFNGSFNGDGHTISNVNLDGAGYYYLDSYWPSSNYIRNGTKDYKISTAFFGYLGSSAVISNLKLSNITFTNQTKPQVEYYTVTTITKTAPFFAECSGGPKIKNCWVDEVNASFGSGFGSSGFLGNTPTVTDCMLTNSKNLGYGIVVSASTFQQESGYTCETPFPDGSSYCKKTANNTSGLNCSSIGGEDSSVIWYYGGSKYNNGFPMLRKFIKEWKFIVVTQPTSGGTIKEGGLQASKIYIPSNNVVVNGTTYYEPITKTEAVSKTFQTQILTIFASVITVDVSDGYSFTNFKLTPNGHVNKDIQIQSTLIWELDNWELTATLSLNPYTITYNLNEGSVAIENPASYTVETEDFTLNNPTRTGYTFTGWTGSNGTTPQKTVTISKGSTGDKTYTANWSQIYSISWDTNGGAKETTYTDSYTVEDTQLSFEYSPTRTGYKFAGWTGSDVSTPQETITLARGTTGDKSYTANWEVVTYYIIYNLNDGSVTTANPTTYTIETDTFTLTNPTKSGYEFKGWTGSNGTTPQKTVTISKGSTGYRFYKANWGIKSYSISWDTNGGTKEKTYTNSYTVENTPLSFTYSPTKKGYTFTGWTGSNGTTSQKTITLASGTTGNKSYKANWQVVTYNISYNLNEGSVATANPTTYTIETDTFTLTNPTKSGYEFKGWTGSNGTTPQTTVQISKGSTGDKSYTANWGTITYNITYDLTNGKLPSGKTNPSTYTVETPTFTLNNPEMTGYTFTGWTGTGLESKQTTVTIEQGSTGDRTYTANWEVTRINITFSIVDGATMYVNDEEKTADYTVTILYNQEITTTFDGANNTYSYILTTKDNVQIKVKYIPTLRKMCVSKFNLPNEIEGGEETSREEPSWEAKTEDIDGTTFTITPTISLKQYGVEVN